MSSSGSIDCLARVLSFISLSAHLIRVNPGASLLWISESSFWQIWADPLRWQSPCHKWQMGTEQSSPQVSQASLRTFTLNPNTVNRSRSQSKLLSWTGTQQPITESHCEWFCFCCHCAPHAFGTNSLNLNVGTVQVLATWQTAWLKRQDMFR